MNKAIFLDRDGVLNEDPGYVHKLEDFKFIEGSVEGLKLLSGFKLFIVTNQSGIGRGYYTKEDFEKFNGHLVSELAKNGIKIEKTYCCPHHPDDKCDCRKPNGKFLEQAKEEFNIDLEKSYMVGDHPNDIEFGDKKGCKTVFVLTGHGKKHKQDLHVKPDHEAENLFEAAKWIIKNEQD